MIASSPTYLVVLDLPSLPEDLSILSNAQVEILLLQVNTIALDFEFVSRLQKAIPKIKILMLLDDLDEELELRALQAGARGCIARNFHWETFAKAFEVIGRGELWASHHTLMRFIERLAQKESADGTVFTHREWEILAYLAKGLRNKDIANTLSISENTVKTHLAIIYRKINVDSRLAATIYYFHHAKSEGRIPT